MKSKHIVNLPFGEFTSVIESTVNNAMPSPNEKKNQTHTELNMFGKSHLQQNMEIVVSRV